ncbi:thiol:disulfide interchange protein DsbD [Opitutaceae bacterium TAV5]|nr:thiol:disulfide interchange protein DsbD [Opitutaceae bacterium TAV5]
MLSRPSCLPYPFRLRRPFSGFAIAFAVVIALGAALPAARAQVKASLVAADASIRPGEPFTVALRLEHEEHWHTYWINPGTGYPTSLEWQLPAGWKAGDIRWPTPQLTRTTAGDITGNGYEGVAYLPVTLTPPADLKPGETVTLRVKAGWLMCADVCKPGEATLELARPVRAEPPAPDPEYGEAVTAAVADLPRALPEGWSVAAVRAGNTVGLRLSATADAARPWPSSDGLWFFSDDGFIAYEEPQPATSGAAAADSGKAGGKREWTLALKVSPAAEPGTGERLKGVLRTTGADGAVAGFLVDVPIETSPAGVVGTGGLEIVGSGGVTTTAVPTFGAQLALGFLGGLILNLMPCVFPVLGIKILGFVNQAGSDRRKVVVHGLTFTAGVLVSFWALAAVLAVLRSGGQQLGWGFQLQSPVFIFVMAVVLLVFALSLSGVFEFGLSATGVGARLQSKGGSAGSFFTGLLATVVATPCAAPFLAPALGAALALPTGPSFLLFTAIALGLSAPYLLLSAFPEAIKLLPRPGAWMETFKQVMAFPLYATVGGLVWVLAGQVEEQALLMTIFGLTTVALAVWFYGRYAAPGAPSRRVRIGIAGGVLLLAAGTALGWPRPAAPTDIVWEEWSPERVAELQKEGRPIYVDFTARWCFTCQTNKKLVFGSGEVLRVFRDKNIATLRADWTNQDQRITEELARWNRATVPFNLVYLPGHDAPQPLPELLTPDIVLKAVGAKQES